MGEARAKLTRNQRLISKHPYCVYCGGTTAATQVDHAPPISVFTLKRRPEGLEFAACDECHEGTRQLDALAALLSRLWPNASTDPEREELGRLMRGVIRGAPSIVPELSQMLGSTASATIPSGEQIHLIELGPTIRSALEQFCARLALAFHYRANGCALLASGVVSSRVFTNLDALDGAIPDAIWTTFPRLQALHQKGLRAHEDFQFAYDIGIDVDATMSFVAFRQSFAAICFCVARPEDFPVHDHATTYHPGFLRGLRL